MCHSTPKKSVLALHLFLKEVALLYTQGYLLAGKLHRLQFSCLPSCCGGAGVTDVHHFIQLPAVTWLQAVTVTQ